MIDQRKPKSQTKNSFRLRFFLLGWGDGNSFGCREFVKEEEEEEEEVTERNKDKETTFFAFFFFFSFSFSFVIFSQ